jgi:DNA-binding PucR family transcriptional regulator
VLLDGRTLQVTDDLPGLGPDAGQAALLVPDAGGPARAGLLRALEGREAVVGPARPWQEAARSYARAVRAARLSPPDGAAALDTDRVLAELVLRADDDALADLRAQVLAPLDQLPAAARDKLTETLRSWLLHHGRRERVAAELFVHPQTVRYRMGQLRDLYGDRLEDPGTVLALVVALGADAGSSSR